MNNKMRLLVMLSSLVLSLAAARVALGAENLLDIYRLAAKSDPQLKAAEAAHQAALTVKPQARALYFPNAGLSANTARSSQDYTSGFSGSGSSNFDSHGYTLSISQPVFHYDYLVQNRRADAAIGKADAEYGAAQQSLVLRVSEAYFNVLAATDRLEFARSEKSAIGRQLEQARKRFEVGMVAITDVHEAKAAYDLASAQEIAAANDLTSSREALGEITGRYHEHLAGLGAKMPLVAPEPTNMDRWTKVALDQNLQLRAARYASEAAREGIDLQRAGHFPTLDVVASRSNSYAGGGSFGSRRTDTNSIALQFNLPLYQGGLVTERTKQAAHLYTEAKDKVEQQRRATVRQTHDAYRGVLTGISRVDALRQAVISNQSALEATEAGFQVGTRTIIDVLLAQRNLFGAKRDYAQSRYDYVINTLRLKQAAGTLSPDDLKQVNNWLKK